MKPGRELDSLIAEKVMGLTEPIPEPEYDKIGETCESILRRALHFPHYSTDISAAWEVVEKIKENSSISIFTTHIHGPEETEILIDGFEMIKGDYSIPHSICLAALKAVGHAD